MEGDAGGMQTVASSVAMGEVAPPPVCLLLGVYVGD